MDQKGNECRRHIVPLWLFRWSIISDVPFCSFPILLSIEREEALERTSAPSSGNDSYMLYEGHLKDAVTDYETVFLDLEFK